ncbi:MAG: hypothetical protein ACXWYC_08735 [Actinomycetota bacterium]
MPLGRGCVGVALDLGELRFRGLELLLRVGEGRGEPDEAQDDG